MKDVALYQGQVDTLSKQDEKERARMEYLAGEKAKGADAPELPGLQAQHANTHGQLERARENLAKAVTALTGGTANLTDGQKAYLLREAIRRARAALANLKTGSGFGFLQKALEEVRAATEHTDAFTSKLDGAPYKDHDEILNMNLHFILE